MAVVAAIHTAEGQGMIRGRVIEAKTGRPVGQVAVLLPEHARVVASDEGGRFELGSVPSGSFRIVLKRLGYKTVNGEIRVPAPDTVELEFSMEPMAATLDSLVVSVPAAAIGGRLEEFDRRRTRGQGQFLTAARLRENDSRRFGDVLRRLRGVRVVPLSTSSRIAGVSGQAFGQQLVSQRDDCAVGVVVDGVVMEIEEPFDLDRFPTNRLEAVELYLGPAETPPEFAFNGGFCGVLVLWTRIR